MKYTRAMTRADHSQESFRALVSDAIESQYGSPAKHLNSEDITEPYRGLAKWRGEVHEYKLDRPVPTLNGHPHSETCFVIFWKDQDEPMISFYLKTASVHNTRKAVHALIAKRQSEIGADFEE